MRTLYQASALFIVCFTVLAGCAGTPPKAAAAAGTPLAAEPSHCLKYTGSRIPPPDGRCLASSGHVFFQDDLRRTGAIDVGEALSRLLP